MVLIGMRGVTWGFGGTPLLEDIHLHIERGERVCLLGRNGLGKSTVLRLLQGEMTPDSGEVWRQPNTTIAGLGQEVPESHGETIFDVVAGGFGPLGETLSQYRTITNKMESIDVTAMDEHAQSLQHRLDSESGWELLNRIETLLTMAGLPPEDDFSTLSAGMKRRVLFARAIATEPDVLMLDEPTNHLDMEAIAWMEDFILQNVKTLVFVTHDRAFLKRIATRIVELDLGRAVSYPCDYDTYLARKQAAAEALDSQQAEFDKKLSAEEAWLRQGVKARRTRNEGRVRALLKMREERRNRRKAIGNVNFRVDDAVRTGKMVIEANSVSCIYGDNVVLSEFSTRIIRGDRIGIIGPNGVGKSTLLNILLKKVKPDTGEIRHGAGLMVASFDQLRESLDADRTVADNIGNGSQFITVDGKERHVISHLKDFLFSPQRCRTPVHILSGGEKNRLLLAKLFARPANVLVLDEPTNDLDIETLELLEEMLFHFKGTILLVSHDRAFLNNVVTSTLVFEAPGQLVEYAGGYDDWLLQRKGPEKTQEDKPGKPAAKPRPKPAPKNPEKITFREKQELEGLYEKIEALETEHEDLCSLLSDPDLYKKAGDEIARTNNRLQVLVKEIEQAHQRWEALEAKNSNST
jgi:ABC transport system ATP-binding/permease protein